MPIVDAKCLLPKIAFNMYLRTVEIFWNESEGALSQCHDGSSKYSMQIGTSLMDERVLENLLMFLRLLFRCFSFFPVSET